MTHSTATLNSYLDVLVPHLAESLVPATGLSAVRQRVGNLPVTLTNLFGFECPLSSESATTDFQFAITPDRAAEHLTSDCRTSAPLPHEWHRLGGSHQVQTFADWWQTQTHHEVPSVILGIDCSEPAASSAGMLFHLRTEKRTADEILQILAHAGQNIAADKADRALAHCLQQATPTYTGIMFRGPCQQYRLTQRLPLSDVLCYLESVDWPGDRTRVNEILSAAEPWSSHIALSLNVNESVQPYLGIEVMNWSKPAAPLNTWRQCLNWLSARQLCSTSHEHALMAWSGLSHPRTERWPETLLANVPENMLPVLTRRLSHLKFVLRPGQPLQVKAYLEAWCHQLQSRPVHQPALHGRPATVVCS